MCWTNALETPAKFAQRRSTGYSRRKINRHYFLRHALFLTLQHGTFWLSFVIFFTDFCSYPFVQLEPFSSVVEIARSLHSLRCTDRRTNIKCQTKAPSKYRSTTLTSLAGARARRFQPAVWYCAWYYRTCHYAKKTIATSARGLLPDANHTNVFSSSQKSLDEGPRVLDVGGLK